MMTMQQQDKDRLLQTVQQLQAGALQQSRVRQVFIPGSVVADLVLSVPRMPLSGEDLTAQYEGCIIGGCAFNVADVFYKLHVPCTPYLPVGRGQMAELCAAELERRGMPVYAEDTPLDNGWNVSLSEDSGERSFITVNGIEQGLEPAWLQRFDFRAFDYIYLSGYQAEGRSAEVLLPALQQKKPASVLVFDPGPRSPYLCAQLLAQIEQLDCCYTVNAAEARALTGCADPEQAARLLCARTGNFSLITLGADGCLLCEKGQCSHLPGFKVQVADTIGSGDAFRGGLLCGLACSLSLYDSALLGLAVSAFVTAHRGAACAPEVSVLRAFLSEQFCTAD